MRDRQAQKVPIATMQTSCPTLQTKAFTRTRTLEYRIRYTASELCGSNLVLSHPLYVKLQPHGHQTHLILHGTPRCSRASVKAPLKHTHYLKASTQRKPQALQPNPKPWSHPCSPPLKFQFAPIPLPPQGSRHSSGSACFQFPTLRQIN